MCALALEVPKRLVDDSGQQAKVTIVFHAAIVADSGRNVNTCSSVVNCGKKLGAKIGGCSRVGDGKTRLVYF